MFKRKKKLKIQFLHENAQLPYKAHDADAGYDLTATSKKFDPANNVMSYGTGLAVGVPKGYVGLLFSRSSVYKTGLSLANCVGVLDSGFRNEVKFKFKINGNHTNQYNTGDRIGQLVVVPIADLELDVVDKLDDSTRGKGGFGSTGR